MSAMWISRLCLVLSSAALTVSAQVPVSSLTSKPIVVWEVGSPLRGDTPDGVLPTDIQVKAEKIGRSVQIEAFAANGFAQRFFSALQAGVEPDVISFDNMSIIDGITTSAGTFVGIGSSPTVIKSLVDVTGTLKSLTPKRGGWQYLVSTSKNYEAARQLAMEPAVCDAGLPPPPIPAEVQTISRSMSIAYLQQEPLKTYDDANRLIAAGERTGARHVLVNTTCGYWGNDHLAFVLMLATYESPKAIGQVPVLLVLRREDAQWRLLTASTDPITTGRFVNQLRATPVLYHGTGDYESKPSAAELLSPTDGERPADPRSGAFTWQPSSSENVVVEIIEFSYQNDARLFLRLRSKAFTTDQISAGELWMTGSKWKWRVWSITGAGAVAFSQSRSFPN
jgi:hypothetical protein